MIVLIVARLDINGIEPFVQTTISIVLIVARLDINKDKQASVNEYYGINCS